MIGVGYFRVTNPLSSVYHFEDVRGVYATLLLGSRGALLVDTATGIGNLAKAVGFITDFPPIVVNSHGHIDHTSGNYQFPEVYLSYEDWELAKKSATIENKKRIISLSEIIPSDFKEDVYFNYQYDNLVPFKEDAIFDLGGISVQPIPLPSHSPGSMGFLCPELGLLLSGDSIAPLVCLVFPESLGIIEYINMLEQVKELSFSSVLSSHSERLIPKDEIDIYIECAKSINLKRTVKYKSSMFPEYTGRIYFYENPTKKGDFAAIIY